MSILLLLVLSYLLIGAVVGLLSGLLGIGGGVVMVPCLTILLSYQHVPESVLLPIVFATSLAVIAVTNSISLFHYCRSGHDIWSVYSRLFFGLCTGVILGVVVTVTLHPSILRMMFGVFLIVIAGMLVVAAEPRGQRSLPGRLGLSSVFFLIGFKSGLFGVGGGLITTPYLLYCNVPVRRAFAIACASSATIAVLGVIAFSFMSLSMEAMPSHTVGYVYWPAFCCIAMVSPFMARYGVRCAHHFSTGLLRKMLAFFIFLAGVDMLMYI